MRTLKLLSFTMPSIQSSLSPLLFRSLQQNPKELVKSFHHLKERIIQTRRENLRFQVRFGVKAIISLNRKRYGVCSKKIHPRCLSSEADFISEYEDRQPSDDGKIAERDAALHLALSQLAGDFGRESMLSLHRFSASRYAPVIPTGSVKLDLALGIGGFPKGRIVEIYGQEASGKTTLALHVVKEAQKLGGYCAYIDAENALNLSLAEAIGVNTENLLLAHPNSAENSYSIIDTLVKSGSIDVIVVDSVAALVPQCELDRVIDGKCPETQSRLMMQALRKIHLSLWRSQTLLVLINQVRLNLTSLQSFGCANGETCGGNSLKFYSAIRIKLGRTGLVKTEDEITGIKVSVQVVKNKLSPAMKKAELEMGFGKGICREAEVLEMASKHGIVLKEGNSYWIEGTVLKDKMEAERYLVEQSGVLDELITILRNQLFDNQT